MTPLDCLHAAYSPELFEQLGQEISTRIAAHLGMTLSGESHVLNWNKPSDNLEIARQRLREDGPFPDSSAEIQRRFRQVADDLLERGHNLHNPCYIGHQVPASIPLSALFTTLASALNQVMAIYEMGPWISAIEREVTNLMGHKVGWEPESFHGFATNGGSIANLTCLLTARNVRFPQSWSEGTQAIPNHIVLLIHPDSHYCIHRSAGILGLGAESVITLPIDEKRRIIPAELQRVISDQRKRGNEILAVCASAGATFWGSFDPLPEIAAICRQHNLWLHVDAAHGGALLFSEQRKHKLRGLEQADSFICDAHKMLFTPALCALAFYKNQQHRHATFRQDASYLFEPPEAGIREIDSGLVTLECTKQALVVPLWGILQVFGEQLIADAVDTVCDQCRTFHRLLAEADDFEPVHEPEMNIQVYRHIPAELRNRSPEELGEFNLQLRQRIAHSGEYYIVPCKMNGIGALRSAVMNPFTNEEHFKGLLNTLRRIGHEIL